MTPIKDLKDLIALAELIKRINNLGNSPATSTNYSLRSKEDQNSYFVSQSGIDKSKFEVLNLLWIDEKRKFKQAIDEHKKLSAETDIHLFLYQFDQEIGAILHSHSLPSTLLSSKYYAQKKIIFSDLELIKGIEGQQTHLTQISLPIVENSQKMEDICQEAKAVLSKETKGFLIKGHGLYVWGRNVTEAKRHLETYEYLLQYNLEMEKLK